MSLATPHPTTPQPDGSDPPAQGTVQYRDCDEDASAIDLATRSRVASANGGQCWLCGLHGKHPTRVVTSTDMPIFEDFQQRGVIDLPDLDTFENLLFLCPACHVAFKDPDPVWSFLPTGLDDLIASEEDFQARRQASAMRGEGLPRPRPTKTLPLLYTRYQIRPGYLFTHIFTSAPTKQWPGSPHAAIVRSTRLVTSRERLPVEDGGMPMDVALKLQTLLLLYGAPKPRLVVKGAGGLDEREPQFVPKAGAGFKRPTGGAHDVPLVHVQEESERDAPSSGPVPSLHNIGDAFNEAIQYVQDHSEHHNLTPETQAWLTTAVHSVVSTLRKELCMLHKNKDNPVLLPDYALDSRVPFTLYTSCIPFVLRQYSNQLLDWLMRLLEACGLKATGVVTQGRKLICLNITFSPGASGRESNTIGNRIFDPEFESAFVSGIQSLVLDSK